MRPGERGTAAEQLANLRRAVTGLRPLFAETEGLVITHGNGPQVGNELLRQERAAAEAPPLPLWLAVAQTQAEIGALIAAELRPALDGREVACLLTHVTVSPDDHAFDRPTKPIGPFYSAEQAEVLERERGWALVRTRTAAIAASCLPPSRSRSWSCTRSVGSSKPGRSRSPAAAAAFPSPGARVGSQASTR
jgi:carbamate kinase